MNIKLKKISNIINLIIPTLTLILISFIVYKSLINKNKVDNYEEYFTIIENKSSEEINITNDKKDLERYKKSEVSEYVNCLNKELTYDELSDKLKLSIRTLENLFNSSYNYFAFKYTDIYTGFSVEYNADQEIFTASTIKAPEAIYLYEKAEKEEIDLNKNIMYTPAYYNTGSGILKNREFNQNYTTRELISYAIIYSDNAAHNMLMDNYGRVNMYNFWKEKGTTAIFKYDTNWGSLTANDATIYFKELYNYYNTDTELANELMNNFLNVTFKPLSDKNGNKNTANKSGWSGTAFHDAAIIFDDNPYILVVLSNVGYSDYSYLFNTTSTLIGQLHEEYWNYKYSECQKQINR